MAREIMDANKQCFICHMRALVFVVFVLVLQHKQIVRNKLSLFVRENVQAPSLSNTSPNEH